MKLGALNSAIRSAKEVRVPICIPGSGVEWVRVQKTDLLSRLKDQYGNARSEDVPFEIDADGHVTGFAIPDSHHCVRTPPRQTRPHSDPDQVDLEDLLGAGGSEIDTEDLLA